MFRSETSRNSSFLLSNPGNQSSFKHVSAEGEFLKSREFMGSDLFHNQSQQSCGLARYRSAPSSFLAALLDSTTDNSSSGDESEAILSALMNGPPDLNQKSSNGSNNQILQYHMKQEVGVEQSEPRPGHDGFIQNGHMGYESAVSGGGGAIVGSYSVGMESQVHVTMSSGSGNSSHLVRQSSSPAGFFNGNLFASFLDLSLFI